MNKAVLLGQLGPVGQLDHDPTRFDLGQRRADGRHHRLLVETAAYAGLEMRIFGLELAAHAGMGRVFLKSDNSD